MEILCLAEGIMWLWMTHNIVSKYIAKEASEDPAFPKQQFPPASICLKCRKEDGQFDEKAVLDFMIDYYSNFTTDGLRVSWIAILCFCVMYKLLKIC